MTPVPLTQLTGGSFGPESFFEMAIPLGKQWKGSKMERGERRGKMGWGGRWRDKFKQFTAFRIVQMCSQDSQETGYAKDAVHRYVSMYVHMCVHSPYISTQTYDITRGLH